MTRIRTALALLLAAVAVMVGIMPRSAPAHASQPCWAAHGVCATSTATSIPSTTATPAPTITPDPMSYTEAIVASGQNKTTTTSEVITISGTGAGTSLVLIAALDPASGAVSAQDSNGTAWHLDADIANGSGTAGTRLVVLSTHNFAARPTSVTLSHPSLAAKAFQVVEIAGGLSGTVQSATATGATSVVQPPSITPAAQSVVIGAYVIEAPSAMSGLTGTWDIDAGSTTSGGASGSNQDQSYSYHQTPGSPGTCLTDAAGVAVQPTAAVAAGNANWATATVAYNLWVSPAPTVIRQAVKRASTY